MNVSNRMAFINNAVCRLIVILILTIAVFCNSLQYDFLWDDFPILVNNQAYLSIDIIRFFTTPANGLEYLPVRDLTYAIDYAIWGFRPFGFHLTNIILYLLNLAAVYQLANITSIFITIPNDKSVLPVHLSVALLTTIFFAVHPLHSESVSFITSRNTLLSSLFTFISCSFYMKFIIADNSKKFSYLVFSLLAFALSLLSKATGIFLPLVLMTLPFLRGKQAAHRQFITTVPFIAIAGGTFYLFTVIAKKANIINMAILGFDNTLGARFAEAVQIPFFYLGKLLLPVNLLPEYAISFNHTPDSPAVISASAAILTGIIAAIRFRNQYPAFFFSLCWFLCSLVPVLHFLPTSTTVADRYAYLPSFGFTYFLAAICFWFYLRYPSRGYFIASSAAVLVVMWTVLTVRQNSIWRSEESLWLHTVKMQPNSPMALNNLGWMSFKEGDFVKAAFYLEKARQLNPDDAIYAFFQGYMALERNDFPAASKWFSDAYLKRSNFVDALYYIAKTHDRAGNRELAVFYYRKVLSSDAPDAPYYIKRTAERLKELGL